MKYTVMLPGKHVSNRLVYRVFVNKVIVNITLRITVCLSRDSVVTVHI